MERIPARHQPLALTADPTLQSIPAPIPAELARLELLVPEAARAGSRDPLAYALAYVERYQGDVLQLEHEWRLLYTALIQAWHRADYTAVVHLVASLARVAGRLSDPAVAEHVLRLGIEASRQLEDRQHLAYFLDRLGILLFSQGQYQQGRMLWRTGLQLIESAGSPPRLWDPLSSFAQIADLLWSYTAAREFADALLAAGRTDDSESVAVAIFASGLFARLTNDPERAYEALSHCLRLLSLQASGSPLSADRQLFAQVVQAELARVQGDYARSQAHTETAIALARIFADRYTVAALLSDQGLYTYRQGQLDDARTAYLALRELSHQMAAPHVHRICHFLEHHLPGQAVGTNDALSRRRSTPGGLTNAAVRLYEPVSRREAQVLQLLAAGLSNREIAERLVITAGTVKKHLEHIYTKLDAHSRTSALARARFLNWLP